MHSAVKPNPVDAMLASGRVSPPFTRARSLTSPVLELASFQKNRNAARSKSSKSFSSAATCLFSGSIAESCSHELPIKGQASAALPHSASISRRVIFSSLAKPAMRSLLQSRPGGAANYKFRLNGDWTGDRIAAGDAAQQDLSRSLAHLAQRLPYGGQRRILERCALDVVKANHRHVFRHAPPGL